MIILDTTTKSLQFKLGAAVATNQLPFSASYVDATSTATIPGEQDGTSNGITAVTIVNSPAASTERLIKNIVIQNADTAPATVTIIYNNNATLRNIIVVTLAVGDQLIYEDGQGWSCLDKNGNIKTAMGGPGGSNGQVQYNNNGSFGGLANGQLPGTATNDNASAGNVGEYVSASSGPTPGTVTISIASPAVITWSGHPYVVDSAHNAAEPIVFTTSGTLPTGITAGTQYWVIGSSVTATTFQIATSIANAIAGTAINTSGTQSGTQTASSLVTLTSATQTNLIAISLTAGDWDVGGVTIFSPANTTAISTLIGGASNTSATLPSFPYYFQYTYAATTGTNTASIISIPIQRFSLASTTTIFLVADQSFTTSTLSGSGLLRARRIR